MCDGKVEGEAGMVEKGITEVHLPCIVLYPMGGWFVMPATNLLTPTRVQVR